MDVFRFNDAVAKKQAYDETHPLVCRPATIAEISAYDTLRAAGSIDPGYITYGAGGFDGQDSGHDYTGSLYMTPTAAVGNLSNGGRAGTLADYVLQA